MQVSHYKNNTFKIIGGVTHENHVPYCGVLPPIKMYNTLFDEIVQCDNGRIFLIYINRVVDQISAENAEDFIIEYAVALTNSLDDLAGVA